MATDMGTWSETGDATEDTQKICDQVMGKAVKYRVMMLSGGTHYIIKVHSGGEEYIHVMVVQVTGTRFPSPPSVTGVQLHKTKDDPLVPFTN